MQNEEDRDESEEKDKESHHITSMNNSKFGINETMIEDKQVKTIDQNNRPSDLPSLSSNHIITSPTNSNSNSTAVWNTDSWADGEFEPIEPNSSECKFKYSSIWWLVNIRSFYHIFGRRKFDSMPPLCCCFDKCLIRNFCLLNYCDFVTSEFRSTGFLVIMFCPSKNIHSVMFVFDEIFLALTVVRSSHH